MPKTVFNVVYQGDLAVKKRVAVDPSASWDELCAAVCRKLGVEDVVKLLAVDEVSQDGIAKGSEVEEAEEIMKDDVIVVVTKASKAAQAGALVEATKAAGAAAAPAKAAPAGGSAAGGGRAGGEGGGATETKGPEAEPAAALPALSPAAQKYLAPLADLPKRYAAGTIVHICTTLAKIMTKAFEGERFRTLDFTRPAMFEAIGKYPEGVSFLRECGFEATDAAGKVLRMPEAAMEAIDRAAVSAALTNIGRRGVAAGGDRVVDVAGESAVKVVVRAREKQLEELWAKARDTCASLGAVDRQLEVYPNQRRRRRRPSPTPEPAEETGAGESKGPAADEDSLSRGDMAVLRRSLAAHKPTKSTPMEREIARVSGALRSSMTKLRVSFPDDVTLLFQASALETGQRVIDTVQSCIAAVEPARGIELRRVPRMRDPPGSASRVDATKMLMEQGLFPMGSLKVVWTSNAPAESTAPFGSTEEGKVPLGHYLSAEATSLLAAAVADDA